MNRPLVRWAIPVLVMGTTAMASRSVFLLNHDRGAWVLLLGILATAISLGNTAPVRRSRLLTHGVLLISSLALYGWVSTHANKIVSCIVDTGYRTIDLASGTRYTEWPTAPEAIQLYAVNEVWELRNTDTINVRVTRLGTKEPTELVPMKDLITDRGVSESSSPAPLSTLIPLVILLLIMASVAALTLVQLFDSGTFKFDELSTRKGLVLFIAVGIIVAACKEPPTAWLSNEFQSRWDDWLRYGTAARDLLRGNLALVPMPGGLEMWGLGFVYFVAAVQMILGPALIPVYIVMHGLHYAIVWACIAVVAPGRTWIALAAGLLALGFVEVDLNLNYAWVLLSDTLPLPLLGILLVVAIRGVPSLWLGIGAGVLFLLRADYIIIGPLMAFFSTWRKPINRKDLATVLVPWAICVALYLLRKWFATGDHYPFPLPNTPNGVAWDALFNARNFENKALALFGRYDLLSSAVKHRFHWWPIHALFVAALAYSAATKRWDRWTLFTLSLWVWFLCTRLATPSIGSYGHRHSLALVLVEVLVVVLVFGGRRMEEECREQSPGRALDRSTDPPHSGTT